LSCVCHVGLADFVKVENILSPIIVVQNISLDEFKSVFFLYIGDERKEVQVKIMSAIKHIKAKLFFKM
jgi:hypothetical protein